MNNHTTKEKDTKPQSSRHSEEQCIPTPQCKCKDFGSKCAGKEFHAQETMEKVRIRNEFLQEHFLKNWRKQNTGDNISVVGYTVSDTITDSIPSMLKLCEALFKENSELKSRNKMLEHIPNLLCGLSLDTVTGLYNVEKDCCVMWEALGSMKRGFEGNNSEQSKHLVFIIDEILSQVSDYSKSE